MNNKILVRFVKQIIQNNNMSTYLYSLNYVKMYYLTEIVRYDEIWPKRTISIEF